MELVRASKKLDDRNNYIRETVNTLDKIGQNLLQNINQIRINIEDVYSTATNNAVRKIKLKDYDEKTKEIDILITKLLVLNIHIHTQTIFKNYSLLYHLMSTKKNYQRHFKTFFLRKLMFLEEKLTLYLIKTSLIIFNSEDSLFL